MLQHFETQVNGDGLQIVTYAFNPPTLSASRIKEGYCSFSYYGHDYAGLASDASDWCIAQGIDGDLLAGISPFLDDARRFYSVRGLDCLWMTIRVNSSGDDGYVVPRLHQDGSYWDKSLDGETGAVHKVGTCLLGPGTLFWRSKAGAETAAEDILKARWVDNEGMREKVKAEGWNREDKADELKLRAWQTEELEKLPGIERVQPLPGQLAIWTVGNTEAAALHSEPDMANMPNGRIFISILPGTEAQVRQLCARWEVGFTEKISDADAVKLGGRSSRLQAVLGVI